MIIDTIENAKLYYPLNPGFEKAFEYLATTDFSKVEDGRHDVIGDRIFAIVQTYQTKPVELLKYEAHKKYIDIQFVYKGEESFAYCPIDKATVLEPYNEKIEAGFYKGNGSITKALEKQFFIFFPQDVHIPGIAAQEAQSVRKVVMKVLV